MKTETPPFDPTQDTAAAPPPAPLANPAPAGLMWAAADLARASIADNTRRAYKAALRQFEQSAFPEADAGVAAYLMRLYQQGRSAACAGMVVSARQRRGCWPGSGVWLRGGAAAWWPGYAGSRRTGRRKWPRGRGT